MKSDTVRTSSLSLRQQEALRLRWACLRISDVVMRLHGERVEDYLTKSIASDKDGHFVSRLDSIDSVPPAVLLQPTVTNTRVQLRTLQNLWVITVSCVTNLCAEDDIAQVYRLFRIFRMSDAFIEYMEATRNLCQLRNNMDGSAVELCINQRLMKGTMPMDKPSLVGSVTMLETDRGPTIFVPRHQMLVHNATCIDAHSFELKGELTYEGSSPLYRPGLTTPSLEFHSKESFTLSLKDQRDPPARDWTFTPGSSIDVWNTGPKQGTS